MALPTVENKNVTTKEFFQLTAPFTLDFEALFQVTMDEVFNIIENPGDKTPDQIIAEIEEIFQDAEE